MTDRADIFQAAERANKLCSPHPTADWIEAFIGQMLVEPQDVAISHSPDSRKADTGRYMSAEEIAADTSIIGSRKAEPVAWRDALEAVRPIIRELSTTRDPEYLDVLNKIDAALAPATEDGTVSQPSARREDAAK